MAKVAMVRPLWPASIWGRLLRSLNCAFSTMMGRSSNWKAAVKVLEYMRMVKSAAASTKTGLNHLESTSLSIPGLLLPGLAGQVYPGLFEGVPQEGKLLHQGLVLFVEYRYHDREVKVYEQDECEGDKEQERRRIGDAQQAR